MLHVLQDAAIVSVCISQNKGKHFSFVRTSCPRPCDRKVVFSRAIGMLAALGSCFFPAVHERLQPYYTVGLSGAR